MQHIRAKRKFVKGEVEYSFSLFRNTDEREYRESTIVRGRTLLFRVDDPQIEIPVTLHYCSGATLQEIGALVTTGVTTFERTTREMNQGEFTAEITTYQKEGTNLTVIIGTGRIEAQRIKEEFFGKIEPPEEKCAFFRKIEE